MTPTEDFVHQQIQPLLGTGETVLALGYLTPILSRNHKIDLIGAATKMAALAALTDRRIFLVKTRIGAFRPLLENHGVEEIARAQVKAIFAGNILYIEVENDDPIVYEMKRSVGQLPSQEELRRLLNASFPRSEKGASRDVGRLPAVYGLVFLVIIVLLIVFVIVVRRHQ